MAGGAAWAVAVLWLGPALASPRPPSEAVATALLPPGLVPAAMIGRLAARRFVDPALIDGGPTAGADRRVLTDTVEQVVLAPCTRPAPAAAFGTLGPVAVVAMGRAFPASRIIFWAGYQASPALRAFGFAATFYSMVLAGSCAPRLLLPAPTP